MIETPTVMLTEPELAARWNKPQRTIRAWRQRGLITAIKFDHHTVRYRLVDVEAYEAANTMRGLPTPAAPAARPNELAELRARLERLEAVMATMGK